MSRSTFSVLFYANKSGISSADFIQHAKVQYLLRITAYQHKILQNQNENTIHNLAHNLFLFKIFTTSYFSLTSSIEISPDKYPDVFLTIITIGLLVYDCGI